MATSSCATGTGQVLAARHSGWMARPRRSLFGQMAFATFLLTQCLDGLFTYFGILAFGIGIEANPIIVALMTHLGHVPGLLSAKLAAGTLGFCLYVREVHAIVALLTGFYVTAAIGPWTLILFF